MVQLLQSCAVRGLERGRRREGNRQVRLRSFSPPFSRVASNIRRFVPLPDIRLTINTFDDELLLEKKKVPTKPPPFLPVWVLGSAYEPHISPHDLISAL